MALFTLGNREWERCYDLGFHESYDLEFLVVSRDLEVVLWF